MNSTINWRDLGANGVNSEAVYVRMWRCTTTFTWRIDASCEAEDDDAITFGRRGFSSPRQGYSFFAR